MKAIFFSALVLLSVVTYAQRPGTLDGSFGQDGITITAFGEKTYFMVNKAKLQTDDKIIVAGDYNSTSVYGPFDPFTIRYTAEGMIDSTYGYNGKRITHIPFETYTQTTGLVISKNNKLLISGYGYHYQDQRRVYDGFLLQLKANGSLDSSFGQNGFTKLNIDGYGFYGALALQEDGKILVIGKSGTGTSFRGFISRLLKNGIVDETFGNKGYVNIYPYNDYFSCKVQQDGKIVIAGNIGELLQRRFFLQRYLPNGEIDRSFGSDGTTITRYGEDATINDIGFQSDGKIIATGEAYFLSFTKKVFATARYNTDGNLDSTFGLAGKTITIFGDSQCAVISLAIQKDDKIILGGYKQAISTGSDFAMMRLTPKGHPDSSFGKHGKAFTDSDTSGLMKSVLLQSDEKIIGAGSRILTTLSGCQLARYYSSTSRQQLIAIKNKR